MRARRIGLKSTWQWKIPPESKLLFPYLWTMLKRLWQTLITMINQLLKEVKSEYSVNFICQDNKNLLITSNKVVFLSDLNVIEKYINNIEFESLRLPQLKSYLKILGIPYLIKNMDFSISAEIIENISKTSHIFNNITLSSWPQVIKISPKSNIAII